MRLLLAFLLVPLIEIALFIQVGGLIGLIPTLAVVILTAFAGTYLVRSQGSEVLQRLRTSLDSFADPTTPLAEGAMILFAGALLLTPGFFTDVVGFALLIPRSRAFIIEFVKSRIASSDIHIRTTSSADQGEARKGVVIDGVYEEVTDPRNGGQ